MPHSAMVSPMRSPWIALLACLVLACDSEDPKLPAELYDAAVKANHEGNQIQARAMYKQLIARFPESRPAQQARGDLITLETFIQRKVNEDVRDLRRRLTAVNNALSRYRSAKGEFPLALADLAPEYILASDLETPWGHPFLYRAFVERPIEDVPQKRGPAKQRFNTRLDAYHLAYLGRDLQPGGDGMAQDILFLTGKEVKEAHLPPVPVPQPVR